MDDNMVALSKLFSWQSSLIDINDGCADEFETVKRLYSLPPTNQERIWKTSLLFIDSLPKSIDTRVNASLSKNLRERGNIVYASSRQSSRKNEKTELVLKACNLYTQSILEADAGGYELSLAYANRALQLQELGYYNQAYDDCICALEYGYPIKLQHKLLMRQAYCSWKLGNAKQLAVHIAALEKMELNKNFRQQLEDLQLQLVELEKQKNIEPSQLSKMDNNLIKIVKATDHSGRGRYVVATEDIAKGDAIFQEPVECFVPVEGHLICSNCAAMQLIPIPCSYCHQRVVYCSLQCQQKHEYIHKYECAAYQRDLFPMLGVAHLSLRLVLTYLPQLMPQLKDQVSAEGLWSTLMNFANATNYDLTAPTYQQTLRMQTHLWKLENSEHVYHFLCANLLQVYIYNCTDFFKQFENSLTSAKQWQIFITAWILRSAGQLTCNAHVRHAIIPYGQSYNEFVLLHPNLWSTAYHIRLGCLHKLTDFKLVCALNLPMLSLCNHACEPTIRTKFDGPTVTNYAARNIKAGEEVFNCYTPDFKNMDIESRQDKLRLTHKFSCNCIKCARDSPNDDFFSFHQYRCEILSCRQQFIPEHNNIWWWQSKESTDPEVLYCAVCGRAQQANWYNELCIYSEHCSDTAMRAKCFKTLKQLDNFLVGHNVLKVFLASLIVRKCFDILQDGCQFSDNDYADLIEAIKLILTGTVAQYGSNTIEYITRMTYLWDLIAYKKYKCNTKEMQTMLVSLDYIADEYKKVFMNYYNDFIEPCIGERT